MRPNQINDGLTINMKYYDVIKKNIIDLNLPKWKAAQDISSE